MYKAQTLFLAATLALGGAAPLFAHGRDKPVTMEELPAAVQKTLKRAAEGGKIEEIKKDTHKDGRVTYEAEIEKDGKDTEIVVSADGKVIEHDRDD